MRLNDSDLSDKKKEFFEKLDALISAYPEVTQPPNGWVDCDCIDPEDLNSPKMITGIILGVTTQTLSEYQEIFWTAAPNMSHWHTVGMLSTMYNQV